jgi:hypothetical protein
MSSCNRRVAALRCARIAWVLVSFIALGCDDFQGRVFLSAFENTAGTPVGIAADVVLIGGELDEEQPEIEVHARGVELWFDGPTFTSTCVVLPREPIRGQRTRLHMFALGELSTDARVRAALRRASTETSSTAACTGEVLDDAVWPRAEATIRIPDAAVPPDAGIADTGTSTTSDDETDGGE